MNDADRRLLSAHFDGEVSASDDVRVDELLADSPEAGAYLAELRRFRRALRYDALHVVPDVAEQVLDAVGSSVRRRHSWVGIAAVFLVGVLAGALTMGAINRRPDVAAADFPDEILRAQRDITMLDAAISIVERGWHPDVPERRYMGAMAYRAPEQISLTLSDVTEYPSQGWVANDTTVVVADDAALWSGPAPCPIDALPDCTPREPQIERISGREPFSDTGPPVLDLVVPVASFTRSGPAAIIGVQRIGRRSAVGIEVTVAQLDPLLEALLAAGNWREFHPSDRAELWLDRELLTPVALFVYPAQSEDRTLWALRSGYQDRAGLPLLEVRWSISASAERSLPSIAQSPGGRFVDGPIDSPLPGWLPDGMTPHRTGWLASDPGTQTSSWSDGRAWLSVTVTTTWGGERLFGDLGPVVRPVLTDEGVVYVSETEETVGIHGSDVDAVVRGSITLSELVRVAESIAVTGMPVPPPWPGAAATTMEEIATSDVPFLVPDDLPGFAAPPLALHGDTLTVVAAGPGARGFEMVQSPGNELSPPFEANVRSVELRGRLGRFSPDRGVLEWVEAGMVRSIRSETLQLDELLEIADRLTAP